MTLQEQKNCSMISSKATVASRNSLHWSCKPLIRLRKILASRSPCGEVAARSAAGGALMHSTPPLSPPHEGEGNAAAPPCPVCQPAISSRARGGNDRQQLRGRLACGSHRQPA